MAQIQNVDLKVVGVTFKNEDTGRSRSEIIRELISKYGDGKGVVGTNEISIELIREPDNKYDTNAIKVLADGEQIGYLGKEYAAIMAPMMDDCEEFMATIKEIGEYKNRPYCEITINQLD